MRDFKKYLPHPCHSRRNIHCLGTNPFTIELWTGEAAEMSTEPGLEFSGMWEGSIVGKTWNLRKNKKIKYSNGISDGQPEASIVTIKSSS